MHREVERAAGTYALWDRAKFTAAMGSESEALRPETLSSGGEMPKLPKHSVVRPAKQDLKTLC